jgi:hypothetical protein
MTFLRRTLLVSFVILACMAAYAAEGSSNTKTFSSDTIGVKLDYPSSWKIDTYRWGFSITDPMTTSSVSIQTYFMPSELENAYDINMNEDFSRIYGDAFESVGEGEKEISGLVWDYTTGHGAIGTPMEYEETTYSVLVEDTVYTVEKFVLSNTPDSVKEKMDKIVESVRLMYRNSELPAVRKYMNTWKESRDENREIKLEIPSADMSFSYKPLWMYTGAGASTDVSFHYLSGDPYTDIDMMILRIPDTDPVRAMNNVQKIVETLTSNYTVAGERDEKVGGINYKVRSLTQGSGSDLMHTRFYVAGRKNLSVILIFAYHDKASAIADEKINELLSGLTLR